mmetsp:Transcript_3701/g.13078  ORF Transcript_3701/g.13078 Transcript_3701/m.13078 type:complete len:411 (-) Transcript_3701:715-1947(-)
MDESGTELKNLAKDNDSGGESDLDYSSDDGSFDHLSASTPRTPRSQKRMKVEENRICRIRNRIWIFLDVPQSSKLALAWAMFIMFLIILSAVAFCVETFPTFTANPRPAFFYIETVVVIIFTIEFLGRLITCPSKVQFAKGWLNWVDFLAIAPYYVELVVPGGPGLAWVRVLRLTRIFRLFKLGRYQEGFLLFYLTFRASIETMFLGVVFLLIGMVLFSSFLFYAEQTYSHFDEDNEEWYYDDDTILAGSLSFFQSIPHTFWWCIVTMTTVGYGDTYPISPLGKLVGGLTFLAGLAIIAFPIAILGGTFLDLYLELENRKAEQSSRLAARERMKKPDEEFLEFLEPVRSIRSELEEVTTIVNNMEALVATLKTRKGDFNRAINLFNVAEFDESKSGAQVENPGLKDVIYE